MSGKIMRLVMPYDSHSPQLPPLAVAKSLEPGQIVTFDWSSWVRNETELEGTHNCKFRVMRRLNISNPGCPLWSLEPATDYDKQRLPMIFQIRQGDASKFHIGGSRLFETLRVYRINPDANPEVADYETFDINRATNAQIDMFICQPGSGGSYRSYQTSLEGCVIQGFGGRARNDASAPNPEPMPEPEPASRAKEGGFMPSEGVTYPCRHCGEFCESGISQYCNGAKS